MKLLSLKPFVPSGGDFELSKRFFLDLGFEARWEHEGYAELAFQGASFILQDFNHPEMQANLMIHVAVDDLDAWWRHIQDSGVLKTYPGVRAKEPTDFPWGVREVHLIDPSGVVWRFAEA